MSLRAEIDRINLMILDGKLDEADRDLEKLRPFADFERRMQAHYQAIVLFHRGRITEAKVCMESALAKYGENVNLLRDLLVCQYSLQDMMGFRQGLTRLENLLIEKQHEL
ncbi:MAG: hypothetical protein ACXVA9_11950, partial [Bdellovibrionales bacterium]